MSISSVSFNNIVQSAILSGISSDSIGIICTDIMDCPVCFEPFTIPVYECAKGHPACSSCSSNLNNKCPSCLSLRSSIPCRPLEWLLEAAKVTCLNSKYGCKEILSYKLKREHERSCAYGPCFCPLLGCIFNGFYKDLYQHFAAEHPESSTHFTFDSSFFCSYGCKYEVQILQEDDNTLFILNYGVHTLGYVANIICMGPSCLLGEYSCELGASCVNGSSVKITLPSTQSLPKWTECLPEKSVLLVPKDLIDSSWDHKIQVCIRRKGENCSSTSS